MSLSRSDTSVLGRWWWTVDRWTLLAVATLIGFGYVMMLAASPAVAERLHQSRDAFLLKQVVFLALAGLVVVAVSLLSPKGVRRLALLGCLAALALTAATLVMGVEIKGARRWISIPGMTVQPSEFLKPCFAVVAAWLLSEDQRVPRLRSRANDFVSLNTRSSIGARCASGTKSRKSPAALPRGSAQTTWSQRSGSASLRWLRHFAGFARPNGFPGTILAGGVFALIALLLKSQPDVGMLAVVAAVFFIQLFIGGLNLLLVGVAAGGLAAAGVGAYTFFPHVHSRITRFMDPASGDSYQVNTALEAFGNGGLLGRGAGEGRVKDVLPDAHADFVFAVVGEEFGMVICLVVLCLFGFIVLRGLLRLLAEQDLFIVLASCGLVTSFGLQAFVNMGSTLHLIPTKGMTLPFVSYGGSSVLAVALGIGMLLALTRRRTRAEPVWERSA